MLFRFNILISILFFYFLNIQAQDFTFGNVSEEEVKMKVHPLDTNAAAVYLVNSGKFYTENKIFQGIKNVYEYHQRIKILKNSGFEYANITIPFISGFLKIEDLQANCYNWENGKIVVSKVNESSIIKETIHKDFKVKKLTFPSVKEGSVIEVLYKWTTEEATFFPQWQFQHKIPTEWSIYNIKRQGWQNAQPLNIHIQGDIPLYKHEEKRYTIRGDSIIENSFIQHNIPAFVTEPYMGAEKDYISKLKTLPPKHWLTTLFNTAFGWQFGDDNNYKEETIYAEARKATGQAKTELEKITQAYEYIGKNYVVDSSETSLYLTQKVSTLIKSRKGTANELNLLYMNILRLYNINVQAAYLSSFSNGKIKEKNPSHSLFDKVIPLLTLKDSSKFYVDISGYPQPLSLLPLEDLNGSAYILSNDTSYSWIPITNKYNARNYNVVDLKFNNKGELKGAINSTYNAYDAFNYRKKLQSNSPIKVAYSEMPDLEGQGAIDSVYFEHLDSLQKPILKAFYSIKADGYLTKNNQKYYIQPLICFALKKNLFYGEKRLYDIDLRFDKEEIIIVNLDIPEGFKIEELPKTSRIALIDNGISYNYGVDIQNKTVKITSRFKIKRTTYSASEFENLKKIYTEIIEKMNENIVLTKE